MSAGLPLTGAQAEIIAGAIRAEIGEWGVSEMGDALPDLIWDHCEAFQRMDEGARQASVQAVADHLYGSGYTHHQEYT